MDGIEKALNAVAELHPDHAILVLIDSDDDCPRDLGPELTARAKQARTDLHIAVILAHREYESWLSHRRNLSQASADWMLNSPHRTTANKSETPKAG